MNEDLKLNDNERQPCEIFCRVMGYIRPVNYFNIGKKQEFDERKSFEEREMLNE